MSNTAAEGGIEEIKFTKNSHLKFLEELCGNIRGTIREHLPAIIVCVNKTLTRRSCLIREFGNIKLTEENHMLLETIAKIIADRTDRDPSEITADSTFEELGIDSLDTVELLMNLEDEIGQEIELDQKVETVGELVKFIESKTE